MVSLKTKFEEAPSIGGSTYVGMDYDLAELSIAYSMLYTYIWRHITSGQLEPIIVVAVVVINMPSRTVHCQVQYSNRFDTTTATLRRLEECW